MPNWRHTQYSGMSSNHAESIPRMTCNSCTPAVHLEDKIIDKSQRDIPPLIPDAVRQLGGCGWCWLSPIESSLKFVPKMLYRAEVWTVRRPGQRTDATELEKVCCSSCSVGPRIVLLQNEGRMVCEK